MSESLVQRWWISYYPVPAADAGCRAHRGAHDVTGGSGRRRGHRCRAGPWCSRSGGTGARCGWRCSATRSVTGEIWPDRWRSCSPGRSRRWLARRGRSGRWLVGRGRSGKLLVSPGPPRRSAVRPATASLGPEQPCGRCTRSGSSRRRRARPRPGLVGVSMCCGCVACSPSVPRRRAVRFGWRERYNWPAGPAIRWGSTPLRGRRTWLAGYACGPINFPRRVRRYCWSTTWSPPGPRCGPAGRLWRRWERTWTPHWCCAMPPPVERDQFVIGRSG